jgi:hypothetical protein
MITRADKILHLTGENFIKGAIYPETQNKFFMRNYAVQIEFNKNEEKKPDLFYTIMATK